MPSIDVFDAFVWMMIPRGVMNGWRDVDFGSPSGMIILIAGG